MEPEAYWWRKTLAVDLGMYLVAIFFFAYLPPSTLNAYEIFIMIVSMLALLGVISHASRKLTLPLEEWSYLATGIVGLTTFIIYETRAYSLDMPYFVKITYGLFLLAGAASGYAAHVIDGGRKKHDRSRDV